MLSPVEDLGRLVAYAFYACGLVWVALSVIATAGLLGFLGQVVPSGVGVGAIPLIASVVATYSVVGMVVAIPGVIVWSIGRRGIWQSRPSAPAADIAGCLLMMGAAAWIVTPRFLYVLSIFSYGGNHYEPVPDPVTAAVCVAIFVVGFLLVRLARRPSEDTI